MERLERILALMLLKKIYSEQEKIISLSVAGFDNKEIAQLMQIRVTIVAQTLTKAGI